ncbi:Mu transposase C-terminal domain-containing protein [Streptomyces sp. NPDC051976]|uniref:Mu transposase C-terminal domain-containing protein n=1 Tax=Streptomyces sp. NPDC051976 TaxID=3154947 RepID=UPI003444657F
MNPPTPTPPPDPASLRALAVRLLLHDARDTTIPPLRIRAVATAHGVHPRTVRRWLANAQEHGGTFTPAGRPHFELDEHMLDVVRRRRGNASAAYQELADEAAAAEKKQADEAATEEREPADETAIEPTRPALPSRATFHRAVRRQLDPGQRAGMRHGETARLRHDVFGKRPRRYRNYAWETDHVEASVKVIVDGHIRKPWITWFVECATDGICGLAITPQTPSRESILVALRDSLLLDSRHGPFGGRPERVRVDGGKDFLCTTLREAMAVLGPELIELPPGRGDLKPTVEAVNGAVKKMLFADMPGYTHPQKVAGGKPADPDPDLLTFEEFCLLVIDWVRRWNTEHTVPALGGKTPAQAWADDLTPVIVIHPEEIHTFTLEPRRARPLTINNDGVHWKSRTYVDDWMHGRGGEKVNLRYMPHHPYRVELYDAETGKYLGPGFSTDELTPAQQRALDSTRRRRANELKADLTKVERQRKVRYSATRDGLTRRLEALTTQQAAEELRAHGIAPPAPADTTPTDRGGLSLPEPSDGWIVPRPRTQPPDPPGPST